ncbi:MAG: transcriptional regulator [Treponema sp.]|nr:MAG: transcriptional regulator [Treponema sp.]
MDKKNSCAALLSFNIKRLRKLRKMSQLDLSLKSKLSVTFINSIENEQKWVSAESLRKISEALQSQPHELFLPMYLDDNTARNLADSHQKMILEIKEIVESYEKKLPD